MGVAETYCVVKFCYSQWPDGSHANDLISIAKSFYYN